MADTSQSGEATYLSDYFARVTPIHRLLVDVGAFGREGSNVAVLLDQGWRGILVEANPDRIPILRSDFRGVAVDIYRAAMGGSNRSGLFRVGVHAESSSAVQGWDLFGHCVRKEPIQIRDFKEFLQEKKVPVDFDLLQVDAEGMDREIVGRMLEGDWRPTLIVVEKTSFVGSENLLTQAGYRRVKEFRDGSYGNWVYELNRGVAQSGSAHGSGP